MKFRNGLSARRVSASVIATAIAAVSGNAGAQEAHETQEFDTIIVTAQKIEQSDLDVPISLSVLTREKLDAMRVRSTEDYVTSLPNVTFESQGYDGGGSVAVRGIQRNSRGQGTVATIDGLPYSYTYSNIIFQSRVLDVESIEVMNGPQGTLGGASAIGGIINFTTAKPSLDGVFGEVTAEYGRYNTFLTRGTLNVPLGDTIALRGLVFHDTTDGAVRNLGLAGGGSDYSIYGGRLALRWQPTDAFTLDLDASYEKHRYGMDTFAPYDVWQDGPNDVSEERAWHIHELAAFGRDYNDPRTKFWGEGADNDGGTVVQDIDDHSWYRATFASIKARYDFGAHQLDFLFGIFDNKGGGDYGNAITNWDIKYGGYTRANSGELRVSSKYDGSFNWVAGVARQEQDLYYHDVGILSAYTEGVSAAYWEGGDDPSGLSRDFDRTWGAFHEADRVESKAAFASVFVDFDRFHFTAGLRYTDVGFLFRDAQGEAIPIEGRSYDELLATAPPLDMKIGPRIKEFTPRAALSADITDDAMAYVQFSQGFAAGSANDGRLVEAGIAPGVTDPEYMNNYEVGIKGLFLDRRLRLSAAVFRMDYSDMQVEQEVHSEDPQLDGRTFLVNAGKARIWGFEAEAALRVNRDLELNAAVGHTKGKIKDIEQWGEVLHDIAMPGITPWTARVEANYERPLNDRLKIGLDASWVYQGRVWSNLYPEDRRPGWNRPAWDRMDIAVSLSSDRWKLTGFFENVLGERYFTGGGAGSVIYDPRSYGVRLAYKFGDRS